MTTYTVGAGQQFSSIAAAVAATQDGDTVLIQAGTYTNDVFTTYHKITLQSVGGLAILDATQAPPNGKAIVTAETDLTVNGLGFTGAAVADQNGAGIRYEGGNLTVQNSVFWNNQDGILATPLTLGTGTITITGSEFSHNGAGDGYSHNIYIGQVASLVVDNSYFHDAVAGHELKSRALATTITNSRIQDNATGTASYDVDLPDGGVDVLNNDVIQKGADASNDFSIHTGGDGTQYANSSLTVTNSTLINDNPNGYLLLNQTGVTSAFGNNRIYGYPSTSLANGPATFSGNQTLATAPTLDTTSLIPGATPAATTSTSTTTPTGGAQATRAPIATMTGTSTISTTPSTTTLTAVLSPPAQLNGGSTASTISTGNDPATVVGGAGALTVNAGAGSVLAFAGAGGLTFNGGTGAATVVGAGSPLVVNGGSGGGVYFGGGNAVIHAGTGGQSVLIGGNGDQLYSAGTNTALFGAENTGDLLMSGIASAGNDVFFGASGTGHLTFITGSGDDILAVGQGTNTVTLGAGHSTVFANTGSTGVTTITAGSGSADIGLGGASVNLILAAGSAARQIDLFNFVPGADHITLQGFSATAAASAIASQTVGNGYTTLGLGDGTSITLIGTTRADASLFA